MGMTRWQSFGEMAHFRNMMDRLFDESFSRPFRFFDSPVGGLPLDVYEESDKYVVEAGLPGVKAGDVDVQLQGNTLTINGRISQTHEQQGDRNYLVRERLGGQFTRSVTLPVEVDTEKCEASFENGVLRLVLPKTPAHQPKRIQIRSGQGDRPQIAGPGEQSGENS